MAYTTRELIDFLDEKDPSELERIFLWQGDVRILLAMVMYLEDRLNVEADSGRNGVPVILVVEDNVRYYSSFLPAIYSEIFRHTHRLLSENLNPSQKMMRMRARPKVLLCNTYEEAWDYFERFREQTLGVVSDINFPRGGEPDPTAGLELCKRILAERSDVRIVLQSSQPENRELAEELGASFLVKGSPTLLQQLRRILVDRFGFGDFVFRMPDGSEIDRASDLRELAEKLKAVPAESIAYHAERNHFANWLKARTEFDLAERLSPRTTCDFASLDDLRRDLLDRVDEHRVLRNRSIIATFDRNRFEPSVSLTRIGGGSLGGKARGVAFANRILRDSRIDRDFPSIDVMVPPSVVLATELFDEFLEYEGLRDYAIGIHPDQEITDHFLDAPLPAARHLGPPGLPPEGEVPARRPVLEPTGGLALAALRRCVPHVHAAEQRHRAGGSLAPARERDQARLRVHLPEPGQGLPLDDLLPAGGGEDGRNGPAPRRATARRPLLSGLLGRRALLQLLPGARHAAEDGVVALALGMGRGGGRRRPLPALQPQAPPPDRGLLVGPGGTRELATRVLRPRPDPGHPAPERGAHAAPRPRGGRGGRDPEVRRVDLPGGGRPRRRRDLARRSPLGDLRPGAQARLVPAGGAPALPARTVHPGHRRPVEIEFAGNFPGPGRPKAEFGFLQMRPMSVGREAEAVTIGDVRDEELVCRSHRVLGNGRIAASPT